MCGEFLVRLNKIVCYIEYLNVNFFNTKTYVGVNVYFRASIQEEYCAAFFFSKWISPFDDAILIGHQRGM